MMNKKPLAVYLHIPFCVRKCLYCDFLSGPATKEVKRQYVETLKKDCRQTLLQLSNDYVVTSVFFGGGTPSLLEDEQLAGLLAAVASSIEVEEKAEITLEANPGTVTEEKLRNLYVAGFNRISFGLQSANNEELEALGRIHTYEEFLESFHGARKAGFANINVDLMYNLPKQTRSSWKHTLGTVLQLKPEHVSAYSLIIEEETPFYERYQEGSFRYPTEEEQEQLDSITKGMLEGAGYRQYEISNYAKEGFACLHNQTYWKRGDYIGLGLGAASLLDEERFSRTRDLQEYEKQGKSGSFLKEEVQKLTKKEAMEEFMFLGLRMTEGVAEADFAACFGSTLQEIYGKQLEMLVKQGLLVVEDGRVFLSKKGFPVANQVMVHFLLEE